ncbi:DNA-binding protein [Nakamurella sp. YIM 132087]|uniref:DNA-binding protein n=1 Tax=Nakamurella alba TaxID=2665158 RepID=A0A7K1FSU0_9ACTN|nr:helicase-associated domain-containing protein [Nakamurella alba]MTD17227.1 DNA-binding protein [Nakamurella alba]
MTSCLDWMRGRSDAALIALLRARPDLAVPAPGDLAVLARRLDTPPSVWRVLEGLNRFEVQLLQALVLLRGAAPSAGVVTRLLGPDTDPDAVRAGLDRLETVGLVRGPDLELAPPVPTALGEFPAGLGPPGSLDPVAARRALAGLDEDAAALLRRLDGGQPRGTLTPGSPVARLADDLVEKGLLVRADAATVVLPREVGMALRGHAPLGEVQPVLPDVPVGRHTRKTVDGTAGGQGLTALAAARGVIGAMGRNPAPALKSGGLGVRELRRIGKEIDLPEFRVALLAELLAALALIATSEPRTRSTSIAWAPTPESDDFLDGEEAECWSLLSRTWFELRREPARAGSKDAAGRTVNALAAEMSWLRGPTDRRFVLQMLADLPPGSGLEGDALTQRLAWLAPLRPPERRDPLARVLVEEATFLGIVAFGAITSAGRALLGDDPDAVTLAYRESLPDPVDKVLVQADLTVVAPGRLEPGLAGRLAEIADIESAGSATVFRVTAQSLRRGFDGGATATDVHSLFERHSATGVPQALTYLIDDTARRHGILRVGAATSYLRSEDSTLIDTALAHAQAAGIELRRLAPTVALSTTPPEDLLAVLAAAGLLPAAEDADGTVVDLTAAPARVRSAPPAITGRREPPAPSEEQLVALVHRMRAGDQESRQRAGGQSPEESTARSLQLLRDAAAQRQQVWIGYVDAEGGTSRRLIEPIAVSGGTVAAFDQLRQTMRTFALHRITGVGIPEPGETSGATGA